MLDFIYKNKIYVLISTAMAITIIAILIVTGSINKHVTEADSSISLNEATLDIISQNRVYISAGAVSDYEIGDIIFIEIPEPNTSDEEMCEDSEECTDNEYASLAIANVDNYVNVRSEPTTDSSIVGKIYDGAVAEVLETTDGEDGSWYRITSGNVEGYIKAEYFIAGDEAAEVAPDYVTTYATVTCDRLNVRKEPTTSSSRIGYVEYNEKIEVIENQGEWIKVYYSDNKEGYVSAEYVRISEEFTYARTIEEDNAIHEAEAQQLARETANDASTAENLAFVDVSTAPSVTYSTNSELRQSIVANAMQYLGNRYVMGGQTLAGGTDCSGFTSLLYAQYGYAISRTPQGQFAYNGRSVSYEQAQPGDIVCYSGNGYSCTHVAIYIGNGQIIHSSTPRRGVITASITSCGNILAIKNVID